MYYLTIFLSDALLTVVVVPMVLITLIRALRKDFRKHRHIAR